MNAVTGRLLTVDLNRKSLNVEDNPAVKDYEFPKRVLGRPPLKSGPTRNITVELELMVDEYLAELRLDPATTMPGTDLLARLDPDRFT